MYEHQTTSSVSFQTWHARLGHPSSRRMQFFAKLHTEIPSSIENSYDCDVCHLAKHKRLPFPISTSVTDSVFDIVHMDVWGPFPVKSLYGHSYFLTIVDDKSRFVWIYPMKYKSEVRSLIIDFCVLVENQYSKKIKCFRTDNAKEFDMVEFYKSKGIVHQTSCVHTPQQNSIVERKHQHLLAVARALRIQANLPLPFWIDCVLHSVFLINATPTPVLDNKTPYEVFFQQQPKFDCLKTFGCLAYASHLPKAPTKMHPKAVRCIFIGFPKHMKGYRLFALDTKTVFVSRDVIFNETIFPFHKMVSLSSNNVVLPTCENSLPIDDLVCNKINKVSVSEFFTTNNGASKSTAALSDSASLFAGHVLQDSVTADQDQPSSTSIKDQVARVSASVEDYASASVEDHASASVEDQVAPVLDFVQPLSTRPSRVIKMPQKYKDYQVNLPKSKSTPHSVAQVLSYHNVSSHHQSFVAAVDSLKEPKNYKQAVLHECWRKAMEDEILALETNHTWDLVSLPPGKKTIGCKWVFRTKLKADGTLDRYKARLVAKGYTQQSGVDFLSTFSPVAKITTIRVIIAIAAAQNWNLHQLDINNAFLHGFLQEEVYMDLPLGFFSDKSGMVCKLQKSLYGLKQASRQWNERLTVALVQQGFKQSVSDSSLFTRGNGSTFVALAVYVDDIILANIEQQVAFKIRKR
ncbi:hypothetical protein GQ457_04G027460 [Hibiscus cannabinus]